MNVKFLSKFTEIYRQMKNKNAAYIQFEYNPFRFVLTVILKHDNTTRIDSHEAFTVYSMFFC